MATGTLFPSGWAERRLDGYPEATPQASLARSWKRPLVASTESACQLAGLPDLAHLQTSYSRWRVE